MRLPESARFHLVSFILSIFAYVACHVKQTRWQEAARAWEMTELPPSILSPGRVYPDPTELAHADLQKNSQRPRLLPAAPDFFLPAAEPRLLSPPLPSL
jgi:hypothetical protein